ncbi:MAG: alpha/beta fold hydrolase [Rhodospirillaceae bacterium]|nr:alpha/beta fold hydrolase [Rhodospirillaceae bacterium]
MRPWLPLAALLTIAALAAAVAFLPACAQDGAPVSFPTRDVDGLSGLFGGDGAANAETSARLFTPEGFGAGAPVPAMVILHGSGGEWSGRGQRHGQFLAAHGIAALVVDTFESRGQGRDVPYLDRLRVANVPDQISDAYAALAYLRTLPGIDPERIGVMGYSMGGVSTYAAAFEQIAEAAGRAPERFGLHVAFYAPCFLETALPRTTGAPVVAIWGDADESIHHDQCARLVASLQAGGSPVAVHWLAGAAHGWNRTGDMRFFPSLPHGSPCRFRVGGDGTLVEALTGRPAATDSQLIEVMAQCTATGYTIGRHEQADAEANQILLDAIAEYLQ